MRSARLSACLFAVASAPQAGSKAHRALGGGVGVGTDGGLGSGDGGTPGGHLRAQLLHLPLRRPQRRLALVQLQARPMLMLLPDRVAERVYTSVCYSR